MVEAGVQPVVVVGDDPGEDRPAGRRPVGEHVAVHEFSLKRRSRGFGHGVDPTLSGSPTLAGHRHIAEDRPC